MLFALGRQSVETRLEAFGLPKDKNTEAIAVPAGFNLECIKLYTMENEYNSGRGLYHLYLESVSFSSTMDI